MTPEPKPPTDATEVRMTLGEHLDELRRRLWKALVALLLFFLVAFVYYKQLVAFVARPHQQAMTLLDPKRPPSPFLSGSYTQPWAAVIKLSFIVACFAASPVILYQAWRFVGAGLYPRERRWVLKFGPASFLLFIGGCVFGYLVLIPYALYGLSSGLNIDVISPTYTFSEYLDLVMKLTLIMGVIFEMPLVMFFLAKIGVCTASMYHRWRRYAIVGNFVVAAVLTPPDVISMFVMVVPLLFLYEVGVVLSWLFARPKPKEKAEPAPAPQG
ncbi:MAG: twin-arginine translocase subunit TatC [Planctomycetes bacterium]|nr:twin-arginine translocase subunit TatC [Planctomycetota bacterium]